MKVNRPICEDKGVFDDFDGIDFCCKYEDIDYQDEENDYENGCK